MEANVYYNETATLEIDADTWEEALARAQEEVKEDLYDIDWWDEEDYEFDETNQYGDITFERGDEHRCGNINE